MESILKGINETAANRPVPPATQNSTALVVYHPLPNAPILPNPEPTSTAEKKKRGRPKKTGADGTSGRPPKNPPQRKHKAKAETSGELVQPSAGIGFLPHIFVVEDGQDISSRIITLFVQGPRSICVLSAFGFVSRATVGQPIGIATHTYEGDLFDIVKLSGSFITKDIGGGQIDGPAGTLGIHMRGADGHVVGGLVAGPLIAAGPVTVTVLSFLARDENDHMPRKQKQEQEAAGEVDAATNHATTSMENQNLINPGDNILG